MNLLDGGLEVKPEFASLLCVLRACVSVCERGRCWCPVGSVWKFLEQRALLGREGAAHIKPEPGHGILAGCRPPE